MKKYSFVILMLTISTLLSSCIKEDVKSYQGDAVAEIDAAVLNTVVAGSTYPILTRLPVGDRPLVTASDSTIRRLNTTKPVSIRINLVGKQSSKDETVGYSVFDASPVPSIAFAATATGQTPSASSATLTLQSAVPNTHYTIAAGGMVTIPANSSFGYIEVKILNNGPTAGQARFLGIQLNNNGTIKANPNYSKIGIAIDQR